MSDDVIREIAARVGVERGFKDARGQYVDTQPRVIAAVLDALGYPVSSDKLQRDTLARLLAEDEAQVVAATIPVEAGQPAVLPVRNAGGEVSWRVTLESGTVREGRCQVTHDHGRPVVVLDALPEGYHRLHLRTERGGSEANPSEANLSQANLSKAWLIAAPRACFLPAALAGEMRGFGITAQVYGLRSSGNFGIGDFSDVADLGEGAGRFGAAFLGLSPLHALFPTDRAKISPYSPSSRLFIDPIFIDPRSAPAAAGSAGRTLAQRPQADELDRLRATPLVEHAAAWALKRDALARAWRQVDGGDAFATYRAAIGEALELHATFEALSEHFVAQGRHWVGDWPEAYRDVGSDEVKRFRETNSERIDYHAWLQWVADSQLAAAQDRALKAGMPIGLYRDLAVGADRAGAELWARPDWFVPGVAVGAPPDLLGPAGQNWGLPPFNPRTLVEQGLQAFRTLVASNMRHAGAIRIDHAFQIQRLYVVPDGHPATEGAYINYPFAAMLAVLRIESHRFRSLVIAEDLGTAPEGFSDAIMDSGILSYRILSFEREGARFKPPSYYPRKALAAIATHDLPTLAGWWRGLDTDLRERFGGYRPDQAERERAERVTDRAEFARALAREGLAPSDVPPADPPIEAAFRYVAKTPAMLIALQLEDILHDTEQANLPGPETGHPNWRRKLPQSIDRILAPGGPLAAASAAVLQEGRGLMADTRRAFSPVPTATYRLQFHKGFTFADATAALPVIAKLGVSHVYASPILKARPGSTHGYDTVDPTAINPELGGLEGFESFAAACKAHDLSLLLDIVPNHMGVGGADNPWWLSLLEWGELSPFADTFDVDWERLGAHGKLVAPNLGAQYGEVLEKGDLKLSFDREAGSFSVWFFEHRFPLCPLTYPDIIDRAVAVDAAEGEEGIAGLLRLGEVLRSLAQTSSAAGTARERGDIVAICERLKRQLAVLARHPKVAAAIEGAVAVVNGTPGLPDSFGALHRLLERQAYRLSFWRVAASDVNYRRFFDIDSLAGVRIEQPDVFEHAHRLVFDLVRRGLIQGLRIDHIDGLADPKAYAAALQGAIGPDFYVVAEKILEPGEALRPWALSGTTGYEMLNLIDGVFVDAANERTFDRMYREVAGFTGDYEAALLAAKRQVLLESFSSELESLVSDMKRIADANRLTRDYSVNAVRIALGDLVCAFPVYRTYITQHILESADRRMTDEVVAHAKAISALPDRSVHDFIGSVLLGTLATGRPGSAEPERVMRFRRRFQQLTGPVMAKSLEDTLFYRYVRFLALNEVGGEPSRFGVSLADFHAENVARARDWPNALTTTATHDTKRGEDARARLLAMSEAPDLWAQALAVWKAEAGTAAEPDHNDQYMFLQALMGAWPVELLEGDDPAVLAELRERFAAYVPKALREAKRFSKWIEPNETYEKATLDLIGRLLADDSRFIAGIRPILRDLARRGVLVSLGRTVLKCTVPGVPDVYQGTGLYDFSLVDPDNRRPVDYAERAGLLEGSEPLAGLLEHRADGALKLKILSSLLHDRRERSGFYAHANYLPLTVTGERSAQVIAFLRRFADESLLVVVPRLAGSGSAEAVMPVGRGYWGATAIDLPPGASQPASQSASPALWHDLFGGATHDLGGCVLCADLLHEFPVAVLRRRG